MRVNVYSEEIGREDGRITQIVQKEAKDGKLFFGVRVWLKSPAAILEHNTPEDDDSSAVTFWFDDPNLLYAFTTNVATAGYGFMREGGSADAQAA